MRNRWRSPSTMGRMAARFALRDRLSGTWRSKLIAAACTDPSSRSTLGDIGSTPPARSVEMGASTLGLRVVGAPERRRDVVEVEGVAVPTRRDRGRIDVDAALMV